MHYLSITRVNFTGSSDYNGKVLMQKAVDDDGYAFIGGHVAFGETTAETIVREFKEEIGADIKVERLFMVNENFFPWGTRPCQQINLYYLVSLKDETQIPILSILLYTFFSRMFDLCCLLQ